MCIYSTYVQFRLSWWKSKIEFWWGSAGLKTTPSLFCWDLVLSSVNSHIQKSIYGAAVSTLRQICCLFSFWKNNNLIFTNKKGTNITTLFFRLLKRCLYIYFSTENIFYKSYSQTQLATVTVFSYILLFYLHVCEKKKKSCMLIVQIMSMLLFRLLTL